MSVRPTHVLIELVPPDDEADDDLERAAQRLRSELLELDVDDVEAVPLVDVPPGSKAGGALDWSQLVVTLSAANGVVPLVISMVKDWMQRRRLGGSGARHKIAVTIDGDSIELDDADDDQTRALIDAFVNRHADDDVVVSGAEPDDG